VPLGEAAQVDEQVGLAVTVAILKQEPGEDRRRERQLAARALPR
jgi:hypothetical protein